jgi:hypothetical protein
MLLTHKLHIRHVVIDVGNAKLWRSGGLRKYRSAGSKVDMKSNEHT